MKDGEVLTRERIVPPPFATRVKWRGFRLLEGLSDLRGNATAGRMVVDLPARPVDALWVFVSTIGELNAIDPFLHQLVERLPQLKLVLITDHPHYRESYLARYPDAEVCVSRGHGRDAQALAAHYRPRMLVVAEIPCLPSDAPCRFSFAFVLAAKRAHAPAIIVNGWLYRYGPSCRMDAIERNLFSRDYLRAFDVLCVQTDDCAQRLIAAGAFTNAVAITGNIKFDGMQQANWTIAKARSPRLLASLLHSGRLIIVAGCVTSDEEQELVLAAFARLREKHPDTLLVLAPRHPEVASRMQALRHLLEIHSVEARFRSSIEDAPLARVASCLVLDTIGDLRDFYAAGAVAHVGVDHNVLEPLGFGKPVTVSPGWNDTYPSWPIYQILKQQKALLEAIDPDELCESWESLLYSTDAAAAIMSRTEHVLARSRGAIERHFVAIEGLLSRLQPAI